MVDVTPPPGRIPTSAKGGISRRDFFKIAGATLGAAALAPVVGACAPEPPTAIEGEPISEGLKLPAKLQRFTVGEILDNAETDPTIKDLIAQTEKDIYGQDTQRDDYVFRVSKPKSGQSVVIRFLGLQPPEQQKKGKGEPEGLQVQFQLKEDTSPTIVYTDALHPNADLVHRLVGTNQYFMPFSPVVEQNSPGWRGWVDVSIAQDYTIPFAVPLAETPDDFYLFIPKTLIEPALGSNITRVDGFLSDVSYPAVDK